MSGRKYTQRGYMDDEAAEKRSVARERTDRGERPRGRGLGKPTQTLFRCAGCGKQEAIADIGVESVCSSCGRDLHTCTNCIHFDTAAPNECREPISTPVAKKTKRNECETFSAKRVQEFEADAPTAGDARSEFDALFDL